MWTMASRKNYFTSRRHRFLPVASNRDSLALTMDSESAFEFDESEIYNSGQANSFEFSRSLHGRGSAKKKPSSSAAPASASVPVIIPDWSKILGHEYTQRNHNHNHNDDNDDEDHYEGYDEFERSVRVPPHEFLARTRVASFSVHEGVGRTLKGRDLSTLRNAIWAKTGFQDWKKKHTESSSSFSGSTFVTVIDWHFFLLILRVKFTYMTRWLIVRGF